MRARAEHQRPLSPRSAPTARPCFTPPSWAGVAMGPRAIPARASRSMQTTMPGSPASARSARRDRRTVRKRLRSNVDTCGERIDDANRKFVAAAGDHDRRSSRDRAIRRSGRRGSVATQRGGTVQPGKRRPIGRCHLQRPDDASWNVDHHPQLKEAAHRPLEAENLDLGVRQFPVLDARSSYF